MRLSSFITFIMVMALIGCQGRPSVVTPTRIMELPISATPTRTKEASPISPTRPSLPDETATATTGPSQSFTTRAGLPLVDVVLKSFQPADYPVEIDRLPIDLLTLNNNGVLTGMTDPQKQFLSQNGFVVLPTGDKQFKDIRKQISVENGQPYYLTVDAAYHALHVTFNDLLEALEREYFHPMLERILLSVSQKVGEYAQIGNGTSLEEDTQLAQNYLAVAQKLLKPELALDPETEKIISPQIAQIMSYKGKDQSALIPGFMDDYGAYRPAGHYAGKPELENYFRAMTWLGRVAFKFQDVENPDLEPSRAPLLITLALREASVDSRPAYQVWVSLYEITDFMIGPSDDPGPVELYALMEQVYGPAFTASDLADENKWQTFLSRTNELPAPQINSTFASFSATQSAGRDWRFMGQRFTPDGFIFQNLIFDKVGTQQQPRKFPSGLDVAAAFGSQPALQALEAAGEIKYANYPQQMAAVQKMVAQQPEDQWLNRFYTAWLYAFRPQVTLKGDGYPPYMRTPAWGFKDVNAMLGSWAELKHDTVLYAKMPEMLGGGGPPMSGPAPAYVEPNPDVFYRLAYAARTLAEGLSPRVQDWEMMGWRELPPDRSFTYYDANSYMGHLAQLSGQLETFGNIAERELQGQELTPADYEAIQACLEYKECLDRGMYTDNPPEQEPVPVIAAVSGAEDRVLEAGVGDLNRIYVAVPLEGSMQIAQGGVYSYYEFTQPRSERLTDQAWREKLASANPPQVPSWAAHFLLPGGKPVNILAFRIGDVYRITEEGGTPPLNLRAGPSKSQAVLAKLETDTYLTIVDGPVKNADGTWWKIHPEYLEAGDGWVLENQAWFERSHP